MTDQCRRVATRGQVCGLGAGESPRELGVNPSGGSAILFGSVRLVRTTAANTLSHLGEMALRHPG